MDWHWPILAENCDPHLRPAQLCKREPPLQSNFFNFTRSIIALLAFSVPDIQKFAPLLCSLLYVSFHAKISSSRDYQLAGEN